MSGGVGVEALLPAEGPRSLRKLQSGGIGWAGAASCWPRMPIPAEAWNAGRAGSAALPSTKKNYFVSCLTYRAEEEDEHLERTLEQNKGKMAKKEEKCVLQ